MANNNVQAQETESLNIREAFFLKYKKAIIIAVVAIIVIIAGVFGYVSQISGPREDKASTMLAKGQTYFANQMYEQALKGDAMQTSANGQKLRRVWKLSLQKTTR